MDEPCVDELAMFIARIAASIDNRHSIEDRVDQATKWAQAAYIIAQKWETTPWEVARIAEEMKIPEPFEDPGKYDNEEQHIFWDYIHECDFTDNLPN